MNIEAIAKLLRDIQREHGALPEGTCIIGPEWMPDEVLGLKVVRGRTITTPTLSLPASYKQACDFEDYFPEDKS
jgi:hypothetical protein